LSEEALVDVAAGCPVVVATSPDEEVEVLASNEVESTSHHVPEVVADALDGSFTSPVSGSTKKCWPCVEQHVPFERALQQKRLFPQSSRERPAALDSAVSSLVWWVLEGGQRVLMLGEEVGWRWQLQRVLNVRGHSDEHPLQSLSEQYSRKTSPA
jgi:hypothetical protein